MLLHHPTKLEVGMKCGNRNTAQLLGSFQQRAKELAKQSLKPGIWYVQIVREVLSLPKVQV